jgi:GT2 family glycosyltransferase
MTFIMPLEPVSIQISVVICTRNRGSQIIQTVESVLKNRHSAFELLIVDQSSNDETEHAIAPFRTDPRVRYIRTSTSGLGPARRLSLELVKSDIVLMTDDDCEVAPDWVDQMAAVHECYPQAAVVFCDVLPGPYDRARGFIPVTMASQDSLITNVREWCQAGAANIGIGAGIGVRRSLVQAIGSFDTCLGAGTALYCAEETDLALRALLHGYQVYRTTRTSVVHHGFRTFEEGRQLMRGYMYGIAAMYAKLLRWWHLKIIIVILYEFWRIIIHPTVHDLFSLRIPPVWGRATSLIKGFCTGWRMPIDHRHEIFQSLPALEAPVEQSRTDSATTII